MEERRCIASNCKASTENGDFALPASQVSWPEGEDDEETPGVAELLPDRKLDPEKAVMTSNLLFEVYESFSEDPEALVIMDGLRDLMTGSQIIEALGIDRSAYEPLSGGFAARPLRSGRRELTMSANKPWNSEQTEHVLNQLADSIEAATPSEIEQDILSSDESLDAIANEMKSAALAGIKKFQQRRLHHAHQRYQVSSRQLERRQQRVALTPDARRVQFFSLLKANPGVQAGLTAQHRDLNALTDADIESALEELDALGAIEKLGDASDVPES